MLENILIIYCICNVVVALRRISASIYSPEEMRAMYGSGTIDNRLVLVLLNLLLLPALTIVSVVSFVIELFEN